MIKKINNPDNQPPLTTRVELELLEALLNPEDATYPWNPADQQAEAYFDELEQQFVKQDLLEEEELHARSESFYAKLDNLWLQVSNCADYKCNTENSILDSLCQTLHNTFAAGIPTGWLDAIAQKATEVVAGKQSIGEQLVQCVHAVLPTWDTEDLALFTRPYAFAMRSSEQQNLTSIIKKVENQNWVTLSEIEQAKVSVAIAYHALKQLERWQNEAQS